VIGDRASATSRPWYDGGSLSVLQVAWLSGITLFVVVVGVTIALSLGGSGSSRKLAADATKTGGHPGSLAGHIETLLHASSVQQLQCPSSGTGDRSCQVEFSDVYGTWWATIVVAPNDVVSDPGGNANWLCASSCEPLPKTTGLPESNLTAGYGQTVNDENNGVVRAGTKRVGSTSTTAGGHTATTTTPYAATTPYTDTTPTYTTPGAYTTPTYTTPGAYTTPTYTPAPYTPPTYTTPTYTPPVYTTPTYTTPGTYTTPTYTTPRYTAPPPP